MSLIKDWVHVYSVSKKVAFCDILSSAYFYPRLQNSFTYKGVLKKDKSVEDFIKKNFKEIIEKYKCLPFQCPQKAEKIIWVLWLQGEENAPAMIKGCIDSIRKCFSDYDVRVLTMDNLSQYIDLPTYIYDKVANKNITLVHFSDIIRVSLLAKYGGIWADATTFFASSHPDIDSFVFFSLRDQQPSVRYWPCKGRWNVYFLASNVLQYPLFCFMRDVFFEYWKKYDRLVEYFLVDYVISVAYKEIPAIKKDIDDVPITTGYQDELVEYLNRPFDEEEYNLLLKENWASKLNRHNEYKLLCDGKETYYARMFKEHLKH